MNIKHLQMKPSKVEESLYLKELRDPVYVFVDFDLYKATLYYDIQRDCLIVMNLSEAPVDLKMAHPFDWYILLDEFGTVQRFFNGVI